MTPLTDYGRSNFFQATILFYLKIIVLGIATLFALPINASILQPDCFTFRVYSLFYSPSYDETYFVINGTGMDGNEDPTPNGKRINNPGDFDFGFRLEGIYRTNSCFECGLRWAHLNVKSHKVVSNFDINPQLWPTEVIPNLPNVPMPFRGTANSNISVMHQKAECLFEEEIQKCFCFRFSLREAVEWSYIRYHEKVEYNSGTSYEEIQYHAHTKGLGPQFGIIALCEPWNIWRWYPKNLSLKFMTTASLIVANSKAKIKTLDVLSSHNNITQSSFWKLVPEWTIDFGIRYFSCLCSHPISIDLGYEMTTYFRGTSKLIFNESDSPGVSFNQYSDFYVQGLYLALGFTF